MITPSGAWGYGVNYGLGEGTGAIRYAPVYIASNVSKVAMGDEHGCYLDLSNKLYCWGQMTYGQVGNGGTIGVGGAFSVQRPTLILSNVSKFSVGSYHTCAITASVLKCWGANSNGQLGDLSGNSQNSPQSIFSIDPITSFNDLSLGANHTCIIANGNETKCWGINSAGQLGRGNTASLPFPFETQSTNHSKIFAGINITASTDSSGDFRIWGQSNINGQSGTNILSPPASPVLTQISDVFLNNISCAKNTSNTSYCWGQKGLFFPSTVNATGALIYFP